jgi:hypothetical protein
MKKEKGPLLLLKLDKSGAPPPADPPDQPDTPASTDGEDSPPAPEVPEFASVSKRRYFLADFFRALLVILSLVVAAGFVLILLPQPSVDKMAQNLEARRGARPERVAFLYLGDEIKESQFHVRGIVRNITTEPIERLDAAIRLYGHDGNLLQTVVIRMNKETIAPDEVAQFELVYPNYGNEFAKYSVEFKLREGGEVPYKDMRATR